MKRLMQMAKEVCHELSELEIQGVIPKVTIGIAACRVLKHYFFKRFLSGFYEIHNHNTQEITNKGRSYIKDN